MTERSLDAWADWLLHGRERGAPQIHVRKQTAHLRRVRDRVLRGARIRTGQRVLDVGAGTGLLALEARRRAGAEGLVVALDRSGDALRASAQEASPSTAGARVCLVVGDGAGLPFSDAAFDVVVTRSVLMYIAARADAIGELYRVLTPGGRASVCEAINKVYDNPGWTTPLDPHFEKEHQRVVAALEGSSTFRERMRSFDERDLLSEFVDAGFARVELTYEHHHASAHRAVPWEASTYLSTRPNPGTVSYEEAARAALGDAATSHLEQYLRLLVSEPVRVVWAVAYVTATK